MLNQIERCCRYGERFGRRIIVDTDYKTARSFRSAFDKYFVSLQRNLELRSSISDAELDAMDVFPAALRGRVSNYEYIYDPERKCQIDKDSRLPLTFDLETDHEQELLVHHQHGGGRLSLSALKRMRLHDSLVDMLAQRLLLLPTGYRAVHIRHTDLKIDYTKTLQALAASGTRPLFVATDNANVLADFCRSLAGTAIYSFSELPQNGGKPIHMSPPWQVAEARNRDAILDLLILAAAQELVVPHGSGADGKSRSGYAVLAEGLNKNRDILTKLIGRFDVVAILESRSVIES